MYFSCISRIECDVVNEMTELEICFQSHAAVNERFLAVNFLTFWIPRIFFAIPPPQKNPT